MEIESVKAIDAHGHYGNYIGKGPAIANEISSAGADGVRRRAHASNIVLSMVSPFGAFFPEPTPEQILVANAEAERIVSKTDEFLQWVVVDPLYPDTYEQARKMLASKQCVGIKLHPPLHDYMIADHGESVFRLAAEFETIILSHSGNDSCLPEDFLPFADDFPEVRLILAHLGNGLNGDITYQVRAIQASKHGNIFTDTSSGASMRAGLIEWAVKKIGNERILFGTDTPLHDVPVMRARIDKAEISDRGKRAILRDNAVRLFNLQIAE